MVGTPLLRRSFFARPVLEVAPELLGCLLIGRSGITVRITEVEAYEGPLDPASHAFRRTPRSEVMFGPPGHLYVYLIYGMHWCANVVTGPAGTASALLLRAGEVIGGHEAARLLRPAARADSHLARGPASLTKLFGLDGANSGDDLCRAGRPLQLRAGTPPDRISSGPRVGITRAAERPWRFWQTGSPTVTAFRAGTPRRSAAS